ncbi:NADH-ubiquinone oxidoreductase subunit E family protein [Campylobacter sp. 19-13652]|uniref:NADH-ubiquinone oxidoreductase subunit E family protein n=1 Tax=Campylobacter sp. 19-13652 TaxID=2840180 RepID=UPI001C77EBE1|nr:NADH-ubiquinone oxidoreductase subunit E family protein [Campylobacter sp. 19-13652]BCX78753.1 hypothetical protein LBC_02150 [Campylobacter sp. 19-13652]
MRRVDLRGFGSDFLGKLDEYMNEAVAGEVVIFIFEIGDFSPVENAIAHANDRGYELMNSLKFNQTDWTLVLKKASDEV